MKNYMLFALLVSTGFAIEVKNKEVKSAKNQEKRGTEEDYDSYSSPNYDNNGAVSYSHVQNSHPKEHQVKIINEVHPYAVAVNKHLPVAVKIPVQVAVERPIYQQHDRSYPHHQQIQVLKQVPYYVERPLQVKIPVPTLSVPTKEHPTEFVLTKVPLVYHASYPEQSYQSGPPFAQAYQPQPGYNQGFQPQPGYNQGFQLQQGRNQVYQQVVQYDPSRQYQQLIPAQIAYEGH